MHQGSACLVAEGRGVGNLKERVSDLEDVETQFDCFDAERLACCFSTLIQEVGIDIVWRSLRYLASVDAMFLWI